MKNMRLKTAILTGAIGLSLFIQAPAYAATTNTTAANVTIEGGGLNIDKLASIDFGTIIENGQAHNAVAATGNPKLSIHDYRGNTNGWTLQASLAEGGNYTTGMTLKVVPTSTQGDPTETTITKDVAPIVNLKAADLTKQDTVVTLNPTLDIPAATAATTYTETINWNMVDGQPG